MVIRLIDGTICQIIVKIKHGKVGLMIDGGSGGGGAKIQTAIIAARVTTGRIAFVLVQIKIEIASA